MRGGIRAIVSHGNMVKNAVRRHVGVGVGPPSVRPHTFTLRELTSAARIKQQYGFESTKISDVLTTKDDSRLRFTTDDSVYEVMKLMTQHNVGALAVFKQRGQKSLAGIVTERDYLSKVLLQGRSSKSTKVGDIMTKENKLITVRPDTKVLKAMQLMTDNGISYIPVIKEGEMIGMVSIWDVIRAVGNKHGDVIRAVGNEHGDEWKWNYHETLGDGLNFLLISAFPLAFIIISIVTLRIIL